MVPLTPFEAYTTRPAPKFNPSWWWNSIRGAEWFHLYLWMLKDFLWCHYLMPPLSSTLPTHTPTLFHQDPGHLCIWNYCGVCSVGLVCVFAGAIHSAW
jgi:hypothetical protein